MSASLVGSEMCIRDSSFTHAAHSRLRARSRRRDAKFGSNHRPASKQKQDCLLYTSDAADDM
eukprot:14585465-Alexandrium_andersonii.AAC.1